MSAYSFLEYYRSLQKKKKIEFVSLLLVMPNLKLQNARIFSRY